MITCEFEHGAKAHLRHMVTDALVVRGDELFMVKRADRLKAGGQWALVGGYLERDETMSEGIVREVMEETGYETTSLQLFRINTNPNRLGEDTQNVAAVFILNVGERTGTPDDESSDMKWFPLGSLPPANRIAFDHAESIELYQQWRNTQAVLPLTV